MSPLSRGMGPIPPKNLNTPANSLAAQCASAQQDTSLPLTRQPRSKTRYSHASSVRRMGRRCTSEKSAPRRGVSACGNARYAARPPQAAKYSRHQCSQIRNFRAENQDVESLGRLRVESCAWPPLSLRNPPFRAPQQTFRPANGGSKPPGHEIELQWGNEFL